MDHDDHNNNDHDNNDHNNNNHNNNDHNNNNNDENDQFSTKLSSSLSYVKAPCIGEYTHIRPKEDEDIMKQIQHISVPQGSVVFWDTRIPHANAYRHDGTKPRTVVYCSFLPDIPLNRKYVREQLDKWKKGITPNDQWVGDANNVISNDEGDYHNVVKTFSPLQRRLLGIDPWDEQEQEQDYL